ncbi:MAG: hypothetical protein CVU24_17525 [Betaproteobacteria bacterium HGW-Betaproteobacteria-18]|nr:MAG: hypothetical protein CVU24_17525 [Betaproteobacteria bacterium HGW-Betaproteobacteria-18]
MGHSSPGALRSLKQMAGRSLPALKRQYEAWRLFPDLWRDAAPTLVEAALDVECDLVYSTAPPMSVHRAASRISRQLDVPWVAEYRDPWHDQDTGRLAFSGTIMAAAANTMRRQIVTGPALCVGVSEGIVSWLEQEGAREAILARNGIPDRLLASPSARPAIDMHRTVYFGSFYLQRTPIPYLDALVTLRDKGHLSEGIALDLIGDVATFNNAPVSEMLERRGLSSATTTAARIPHAEVMERTRSAGLLLLLAQQQPRQVPNKLYEYLAANRPILAWVDTEGESARLLRQVGGHFLVTEQTPADEIPAIVRAAMDAAAGSWAPAHPEVLDGLRSSVQLESVVAAVQRLAGLGRS